MCFTGAGLSVGWSLARRSPARWLHSEGSETGFHTEAAATVKVRRRASELYFSTSSLATSIVDLNLVRTRVRTKLASGVIMYTDENSEIGVYFRIGVAKNNRC